MKNEENVFEGIYKAYFSDVYKFVYRRISNRETAEDIVQDVFCAAMNAKEKFLEHPEPKGWLIRTAKNKMRELDRRMKHDGLDALEEESPEMAVEDPDYGNVELEMAALSILGEKDWNMVKGFHLGGIPIKELAEEYGIKENNVRVRLFRLREKLRTQIVR